MPDGTLSHTTCAVRCSTVDTTRCAVAVPSNVDATYVDTGATPFTLTSMSTDACDGGTRVSQGGGELDLCVISASTVSVPAGTATITGSLPLVIIASGAVTIDGTIDVSAYGTTAGPGGSAGGTASSEDGGGRSPGSGGSHPGTYPDGGGGGGALCGAGGNGGTGGSGAGGGGGAAVTSWNLSPLQGGSGGGYANGRTDSNGGAGGGALQIFSSVSVTLNGVILAGGGGGTRGHTEGGVRDYGAGAGGGSGGAVLIEAPTVTFGAGSRINTTGGGGGGGASTSNGGNGQDGAAVSSGRASGGASGGSTYGAPGGDSGADATPDGSNGGSNGNGYGNGGGGGGGGGCILIRTGDGMLPSGTDSFSPSMTGLSAAPVQLN